MSLNPALEEVTPGLQLSVEQWYYQEARLLDNRQYQSWLALCDEGIRYVVCGRENPLVDNAMRGREEMISAEREIVGAGSEGLPVRQETYPYLAMRVERSFKPNAWAENPPARTRRIVGNVEIVNIADDRLRIVSNFQLFYARPGSANFLYAGQRRDELLRVAAPTEGLGFRIASREVAMDLANIDVPTLGLFL